MSAQFLVNQSVYTHKMREDRNREMQITTLKCNTYIVCVLIVIIMKCVFKPTDLFDIYIQRNLQTFVLTSFKVF